MIPIVVYEGVSGAEALGALAAYRAAEFAAELTSADAMVLTREGARLVPARLGYATLKTAPAIVVPGGDARRLLADAALARALRERPNGWTLFGGEAILLADRLGLTRGRDTAAPPEPGEPTEAARHASRLVADGRLLTCRAGDALLDLALHHVAQSEGEDRARSAAERLGREWRPYVKNANAPDG